MALILTATILEDSPPHHNGTALKAEELHAGLFVALTILISFAWVHIRGKR